MIRGAGCDVFNLLIGFLLDAVATPVDIRRAHEQKQRQADKRQYQNCQQPRGGTGRPAALGHEADGNDLDPVIQDQEYELPKTEIKRPRHLFHGIEIGQIVICEKRAVIGSFIAGTLKQVYLCAGYVLSKWG